MVDIEMLRKYNGTFKGGRTGKYYILLENLDDLMLDILDIRKSFTALAIREEDVVEGNSSVPVYEVRWDTKYLYCAGQPDGSRNLRRPINVRHAGMLNLRNGQGVLGNWSDKWA